MSGIVGKNAGRDSGIVGTTPVTADSITGDEIADDAIDSEHYTAASIDTAAIATNQIDETLMKDAFVGDFTDATVTASDYFLHGDATDSGNTKKDTIQGILDLAGGGFTLASEQATTSGTGVTFGSIPTGTKLILVMFEGCSDDAGGDILVTIGDSGGLETSGYVSSGIHGTGADENIASGTSTAAFLMKTANTSCIVNGIMTLALKDSSNYTWVSSHSHAVTTGIAGCGGGVKSLSAELTQVSIRFGGASFDAGSINILYQ